MAADALHRPGVESDTGASSVCVLTSLSGAPVTLWSAEADTAPTTRLRLEIAPDRPVVVGRARRSDVPYLDPAYRPTPVVPGGGSILRHDGHGSDVTVSRGHFTLRQVAGGVLLVNGVPRRGGGVRPPVNGTYLLHPDHRPLEPGEEYLIPSGSTAVLYLPNRTALRLEAA
jgi:hypothetical protein